jgi:hypothetical protein
MPGTSSGSLGSVTAVGATETGGPLQRWARVGTVAAICLAGVLPAAGAEVQSEAPAADKSEFSIFNPTPDELLRPLSADRPDFTESPYTVDAGRVQLEMSFIDYTYDGDDEHVSALSVAPFNVKVGLTNSTDIQFVFDPFIHEHTNGNGDRGGIGDVQIRWKLNIWGNDEGETAFGIMPFIKLPTATDDLGNEHVDGGVIVMFAGELPDDWGLGLMVEFDVPYDEDDEDYDFEFVHTGVLGHDIAGDLGGYLEYIGIVSSDSTPEYQAILGAGVTYGLNENTALDAGVNVGLTEDADDVNLFSGLTVRF